MNIKLVIKPVVLLLALSACISTGKIKTSWPSNEQGTFPFCNPDEIQLSSSEPAQRQIGGTWLQKTQQGAIASSTMLEFKTIGPDKYKFQMSAIGRVTIDTITLAMVQETINKTSGEATVSGNEILLNIKESQIQIKSAKTEEEMDNERFTEDTVTKFQSGRIKMGMLGEANQIAIMSQCFIMNTKMAGPTEMNAALKDDTVFTPDFSTYKTQRESIVHFPANPQQNAKTVFTSEGPADVGVFFKGTDEVVGKKRPQQPTLVFSGSVFQVHPAQNQVVIYHPTNLRKLNAGQQLEIQSRRSGARIATVKVDRLNYTNAIASVESGSIGSIDVADLVVGYK